MATTAPTLKHGDLTDKIIETFYDVYNELGPGFLESVYQHSFAIALSSGGLKVQRELAVPVYFRGQLVGDFRADLLVEDSVLLEVKTCRVLEPAHEAQLLHYLRATRFEVGLLLNFGPMPRVRRIILDNERKHIRENP